MPGETIVQFGGAPAEGAAPEPAHQGRVCRVCAQRFSGSDARFCPFDGEPLEAAPWDPANDPLLGVVVDGRYEVMAVLGEGGMGTVYRVRHKTLERPLALKALRRDLSQDADLPARFIQEAKAAAAVQHPSVVQITDFGTLPTGQPYFVMELLEGLTLSRIIRESAPLRPHRVVGVAMQVAEALSVAHAAGVIHRDLKPDNVHIRGHAPHEVVKVLDFGLAKLAGTSRLTRAGMVFGTPHYMSPEQAAGEPSDHRVDIYALGVVMFEMLTGRLPFEADSFTGVLAQHMYMEVPTPSEVRGEPIGALDEIVRRCLAKKPSERYATMTDLLADLERARAVLSLPPSMDPTSSRRRADDVTGDVWTGGEVAARRLGPWTWAALAVGAALLVSGGVLAWARADRHDPKPATRDPPELHAPAAAAPSEPTPAVAASPSALATASPSPEPAPSAASPPRAAPKRGSVPPPMPPPGRPPNPRKPKGSGGDIVNPWE